MTLARLVLLVLLAAVPARAEDLAVAVVNQSAPTLCAEKDNVYLRLESDTVRRFAIEAVHPAYIGTLLVDRWAPDFTHCTDMANDPAYSFTPRRVTLHETVEWQLIGYTFAKFWRPGSVPVRVGDRVEQNLHLLQLWTRHQERAEEVLVLYPGDGYWRARPLPPPHLRWSAYGSSFLVGPVEVDGRPIVDLAEVVYDPAARAFAFRFARGGGGTLRLSHLDAERIVLDVGFDRAVAGRPFAALRSMFVTEINADVAHVGWRAKAAENWSEEPVMRFVRGEAVELWAGRKLPSRHNTSAPDMVFRGFARDPVVP